VTGNYIFFQAKHKSVFTIDSGRHNTLVVSWKDAADIQLGTPNDALVIPSNVGDDVAGFASRNSTNFFIIATKN
jgi:hypothetical protein